jgi:hypothetical protein
MNLRRGRKLNFGSITPKADQSGHIFDNRHKRNQPVQIPIELQFYNQSIP